MKKLLYTFAFTLTAFLILYSCSAEEEDTTPPPSIIQTPEPEPQTPTQYTLTVTAGEGGTVSSNGGTYDEGAEVNIIASPNDGYEFIGWEGNDSTNESLTVTLNSNQTLQALFELIPIYSLSITTSEGGTVSSEGGEYEDGTDIEITATANEGYRFDGWEGIDSNENTLTLTVTSDNELSPIFNLIIQSPVSYGVDEYWGEIV